MKINGVTVTRHLTREFLRDSDAVERKASSVRRDLEHRAAVNHPNPEYRADPGDLESVLRSYSDSGFDPQGYPKGWTGRRTVDASWTPQTAEEPRRGGRRRIVNQAEARQPRDKGPAVDRATLAHLKAARKSMGAPDLVEMLVCAAWQDLAVKHGDWIRLARLRPQVDKYAAALRAAAPRQLVDAVLVDMTRRELPVVDGFRTTLAHLAPDSNRKVQTSDDHDAAILRSNGAELNLLAIEEEFFEATGWHKKGRRWVRR